MSLCISIGIHFFCKFIGEKEAGLQCEAPGQILRPRPSKYIQGKHGEDSGKFALYLLKNTLIRFIEILGTFMKGEGHTTHQ